MSRQNAPPAPDPVAETFEDGLHAIQDKGKDLKGDQKVFYNSIVERVANNVQVLSDLRQEHTSLRSKLSEQVQTAAKDNTHAERIDLATEIRHLQHDVNLLKQKHDKLKQERSESIARQEELDVILANFRNADVFQNPEEGLIAAMKNKLDRANIKNGEALHLVKLYERIIDHLERQRMHFAPEVENHRQIIARKAIDIKELVYIARDSKCACTSAISEYRHTKGEVSDAKKRRNSVLDKKRMQVITDKQQIEAEQTKQPARAQASLSSQPSVLRNRLNRAAREKREERFRSVQQLFESIRDFFGTNEPGKIHEFFEERRKTTATLQEQIQALREACKDLEAQCDRLKSEIEEAEYTSAKGVGSTRLLDEGRVRLADGLDKKKKAERELEAVAQHQKTVSSGAFHLKEMLNIVEDEEKPQEPKDALRWVHDKVLKIQEALDNEDQNWLEFANKESFTQQKLREDAAFEPDDQHRRGGKTQGFKRAKDAKLDVTTRVLDRNQVKLLALKAVTQHQQQQKKTAKQTK
jgi:hypothetical protein